MAQVETPSSRADLANGSTNSYLWKKFSRRLLDRLNFEGKVGQRRNKSVPFVIY
jgi:hypothetical protein